MGRYTNAKRAELAAQAAAKAAQAAQTVQASKTSPIEPSKSASAPASGTRPMLRNEPRRQALEEMEALDLQRKGLAEPQPEPKEPIEPVVEPTTPPAVTPVTTPVEAPPAESIEAPVPEISPVPASEPIKTVRVKVDGQEFDAPLAEVEEAGGIHAYQRDKASENRLRKASETLAETKRVQDEIARWAEAQRPKEPQQTDDQFIASKIDIIRFGTPEESAAALREVMQRSNPRLSQQQVNNQALIQVRRHAAVDKFNDEFSEIRTNPLLYKLALVREHELLATLPEGLENNERFVTQFDWNKFYRTIGNEIRGAIGRPSQPATAPAAAAAAATTTGNLSQVTSDKEARKASIVNLPTAAARAELPKETKPETREDILNEMRKKRGIPTG